MESNDYRAFLLRISDHITEKKLKELKYLCLECIPEGDLEKISSPLDLFRDLERRHMIGIHDLSFLKKLLKDVTCVHLANEVDEFTVRQEVQLLCLGKQRQVNCRPSEVREMEVVAMAGATGGRRNHFLNSSLAEATAVITS